jgi:hypothetical protein
MYYYDQRVKLLCDVGDGIGKIRAGSWGTVRRFYINQLAVDVRFDNRRGVHKILRKHLTTREEEAAYMNIGQTLEFSMEETSKSFTLFKDRRVKSPELHRAEMLDSYMLAIAECGGSAASFISKIETMTVKEMIDGLAQNGVRFTTDRKGVPKT